MPLTDSVQTVRLTPSLSDQFAEFDAQRPDNSIDNLPLVRSFIKDKGISAHPSEVSPDAIMVLGTATSGPLFSPFSGDSTEVVERYGAVPLGGARETSVTRGVLEVTNSMAQAQTEVLSVRIGNAKKASLIMKERGLSAGARFQGGPNNVSDIASVNADRRKIAIVLEATEEGDKYNNIAVTIENSLALSVGDSSVAGDSDIYIMTFVGLPGGEEVVFDNVYVGRDKTYRNSGNYIISSAQLASMINNHSILSEYIVASVYFLSKEIELVIQDQNGAFSSAYAPTLIYNDISPMSVNVIDPDVDKYVLVDDTVLGETNTYSTSSPQITLENTTNVDQIIYSLLFNYGVASNDIPRSGNYGGTITEDNVGNVVCIRPTNDADSANLTEDIKSVFGYYVITASGVVATPIASTSSARVQTLPTPSWGDNVAYLKEVSSTSTGDYNVPGGSTTYSFPVLPKKVSDEGTATLTTTIKRVTDEAVVTVTPKINTSANDIALDPLSYTQDRHYNSSGVFTTLADRPLGGGVTSQVDDELDVFLIKAGTNAVVQSATYTEPTGLVDGKQYTFDKSTGVITWHQDYAPTDISVDPPAYPLELGDRVIVAYRYQVNYIEAKLRSKLQRGNSGHYFIYGKTIVFGSAQPRELEVSFRISGGFSTSEVIIQSNNPEFGLEINRNDLTSGEKLAISFAYSPELPGPPEDEDNVPNGVWRLTGGSDGTYTSSPADKAKYKEELIRAYKVLQNWPCRTILPVGAYFDDVIEGFNFETGLPQNRNAGFHFDLLNAVSFKSENLRECCGFLATRPPKVSNPDLIQQMNWVNRHIRISDTDTTRAANVITGFGGTGSFRLACVVGTPIMQITNSGSGLVNPAFVYAGMKEDLIEADGLKESMLGRPVPQAPHAVEISNLQDINDLINMRYTAMVYNVQEQQFTIADAPTLAVPNSQFTLQYVVDVTEQAINLVREVGEAFLGKPKTSAHLASMRNQMAARLSQMVPDKLIDFTVNLGDVPGGNISGKVRVLLHLTTAVIIRSVDIETEIRLG